MGKAAVVLGLIGLAAPGLAAPAPPAVPRAELESIQAAVEAAVARVSRPAGLMFGRPSRAYHLKGYGAVVVLAPRALPRVRRHAADGPEARALADLAARHARPPRPPRVPRHRDFESLQEEAEAFRREAERAMEKAERDVLVRLNGSLPEPPEPPVVIAPPAPVAPVAPAAPTLPTPVAPPAPTLPTPPAAPALPGWPFWFGEADTEDIPPDRILSDVRRAIVAGLGAHRGGLGLLGPDEFVVVAVDFVPRLADRARSRTVVARARTRDLLDHRAGRLSADGLSARVFFDEY
jgi:hypothetical protein